MKLQVTYRLKFKNRTLDKSINIDKVIGETQAKKVLTNHLRLKYPKMVNYEIINIIDLET